MILIAHRGLTDGPDPERENHPDRIEAALAEGWDCEIDVWWNDYWFLGHDAPTWAVTLDFLCMPGLWLHCKNIEALQQLSQTSMLYSLNYFWHDRDAYTLTGQRYIWTYPGKPLAPMSICVQPEWEADWRETVGGLTCSGICSKHVREIDQIRSIKDFRK